MNENFPKLIVPSAKTPMEIFVEDYFPHWLKQKSAPIHREMAWILQNPTKYPKVIYVAPRGFAKSVWLLFFDTMYDILIRSNPSFGPTIPGTDKPNPNYLKGIFDPNLNFEIIIEATSDLACDWLRVIKQELQSNPRILEDFGDISTEGIQGEKWSDDTITTKTGFTLMAKGRGSAIRGKHPQKVKIDDLEDDESAASADQCKKITNWLRATVSGMLIEGNPQIIWDGTIIAKDCVIDSAFDGKDWDDSWFRIKHGCYDADNNSIWPEKYPNDWLDAKLSEIKIVAFSAEYLNLPMSSENPIITRDTFRFYKQEDLPTNMYVILAVDPALEDKDKNDYTAFVCLGVCMAGPKKMNIYVLDADQDRWNSDGKVKRFFEMYKAYHPDDNLVEKAGQQKFFEDLLKEKSKDWGFYVRFHPTDELTKPYKSKVARLTAVAHIFEGGYVHFREAGQDDLMNQLVTFPGGRHDDLVDAMSMALARALLLHDQIMNEDTEEQVDEAKYAPAIPVLGM